MTQIQYDLPKPPKLGRDTLRVMPLGGLGEVGRNMTVYELNGKLLIVDCGVLFPEETQPGVDLILPDLSHILDRLDDVVAMVLTHGHEDHIGAVPYLLKRRPDIPIIGSQLTLALVEAKLARSCTPTITGEMYGILMTLLAGKGSLLTPIAAPIAFVPLKSVSKPSFGRINASDPNHAFYRKQLKRTLDEPFAMFMPG